MAKEMIDRLRTTTFSSDPRTFIAAADAIEALQARADNLKQQAKNWAHEARAANSTIEEIYQLCTGATGEPGNWHGAEPVRKLVAERDALVAERDALAAELAALRAQKHIAWKHEDFDHAVFQENCPKFPQEGWHKLYSKPTPPVREPLSYNTILGIYNRVGQEDGAPYRFAEAIEAAIKEQK